MLAGVQVRTLVEGRGDVGRVVPRRGGTAAGPGHAPSLGATLGVRSHTVGGVSTLVWFRDDLRLADNPARGDREARPGVARPGIA